MGRPGGLGNQGGLGKARIIVRAHRGGVQFPGYLLRIFACMTSLSFPLPPQQRRAGSTSGNRLSVGTSIRGSSVPFDAFPWKKEGSDAEAEIAYGFS